MDQNRVITVNPEVEIMNTEMQKALEMLHNFDGEESCCIFKVPQSLLEINKEAYQPQIISIGPYHHGKDLQIIKEHKWRYLNDLLKEMLNETDEPLKSLLNSVVSMENKIRQSYSESIEHFCSNDLAKMMVLDGVFLIELFRKFGKINHKHQNDPIFKMVWVFPFLMRDFLRIENQIPFFVLQELFDVSRSRCDDLTLQPLIFYFFNYTDLRPKEVLRKYAHLEGEHILDLFRKSFLIKKRDKELSKYACLEGKHFLNFILKRYLTDTDKSTEDESETPVSLAVSLKNTSNDDTSFERIRPATKLLVAGVKFKKNHEAKSFLDIKFQNGVLSIPHVNLDDFYAHFILNGIIFEQCYSNCSKDITTYIVFLGCLINTSMDVGLLSESKIIQNYLGTDEELVKFFNNVGKYVAFDIEDNYLKQVFKEINDYCDNGWYVGLAEFKHTYFESPWTFISALAAFVLLSLAGIQTFYTVYPYYYERR